MAPRAACCRTFPADRLSPALDIFGQDTPFSALDAAQLDSVQLSLIPEDGPDPSGCASAIFRSRARRARRRRTWRLL
jgi:hypothetical protein